MVRSSCIRMTLPIVAVCLLFAGCTGTSVTVNPDPASLQPGVTVKCGAVAVKEVPADRVYPPAANMVPSFVVALEQSGYFDKVYYPARPDDKVDMTLQSKFDVEFIPNMGSNLVKSFFTGLTLFILEPVFWFDYDYQMKGRVDVSRNGGVVKTMNASTEAGMSMKFLSLGESVKLEGETLAKAKDSLFKQLLRDLNSHCKGQ